MRGRDKNLPRGTRLAESDVLFVLIIQEFRAGS
jgi:hypothetical protein